MRVVYAPSTMKMMAIYSLTLVLVVAPLARAEEPKPAPAPAQGGGDMDFDLMGDKKPAVDPAAALRAAEVEAQVKLRRRMLTTHQAFGFTTLGLLAVTLILGTLNYVDKFTYDGEYTRRYEIPHTVFAATTSGTFATTALLGLTAPNPYPKPIKFDAALVHKLSMALASACFITNIVLGPISASHAGQLDQRDMAAGHLAVGYAAFAFMATGTIAFLVK
jgi:hypothetical protein